jgi:stage V sporulation protein R
MQLIDQHTKRIMEGCKERALDAGLKFDKETLEYIVTNEDLLELSPKNMIPTLYDYWLQDIEVLRGKGEYEIYPNNPYETVINTRPVISFYNDNNPDWLNVMIFYHVLGHIDFFQNNKFFKSTWDYDFKEKALTEKRIIARLRSQKKRKVDYIIEFAKGLDNLIGYYDTLANTDDMKEFRLPGKADYYFNVFLQDEKIIGMKDFLKEIEVFDRFTDDEGNSKEEKFISYVLSKFPEFENLYDNYIGKQQNNVPRDILQFVMAESSFLNKEENKWMNSVIDIVRDTSLYFAPMIRTKTMNEGWASYWHEKLFMRDDRIKGNEVAFARINAKVTALSKVGLNPYAIGWRLFNHIEELSNKGQFSYDFVKLLNIEERKSFNKETDSGRDFIFKVRENFCDFTFLNRFIEQDFVDKYKLMVVGQRINPDRNTKQYYVKSRKAKDYKKMIMGHLYHPPHIKYKVDSEGRLLLEHTFEGKELYRDYIQNTLIGLEYLWGNSVQLETTEIDWDAMRKKKSIDKNKKPETILKRVRYTSADRKVNKVTVNN